MRLSKNGLDWGSVVVLALAACSGKYNDIGDLPDEPGGQGNVAGEGLAGESEVDPDPPHAGTSGTGGTSPGPIGQGGDDTHFAGGPPIEELECETCELVAEGTDVREIRATESSVYWVEYGTFDDLGNYEGNGRLVAAPQAGGEPTAIATDLQAPIGLKVGEDYAYVLVEHSSAPKGETQLMRVPLAGGGAEIVEVVDQDLGALSNRDRVFDWFDRYFVSADAVAYWVEFASILRQTEASEGPFDVLYRFDGPNGAIHAMAGDESLLYFIDADGLKTLPYSGGTPTLLRAFESLQLSPTYYQLSVSGDYIYAHDGSYVVRMPKTGGVWKRLAELWPAHLRVDGASFFTDPAALAKGHTVGCSLVQTSLDDPSIMTTLARSPMWYAEGEAWSYWRAWDVGQTSVYFAWENQLYRVPRAN
jgi:hypothetical protein